MGIEFGRRIERLKCPNCGKDVFSIISTSDIKEGQIIVLECQSCDYELEVKIINRILAMD